MSDRAESWDLEAPIKVDFGGGRIEEVPVWASATIDDGCIGNSIFIRVKDLVHQDSLDDWDIITLASKSKSSNRFWDYDLSPIHDVYGRSLRRQLCEIRVERKGLGAALWRAQSHAGSVVKETPVIS